MKCDHCGYEWISVSPVEAQELECPVCHEMTSVKAGPPEPVPPTLPVRDTYTYWSRRDAASQRMLARVLNENRVRDECLEIAMKALKWYAIRIRVIEAPRRHSDAIDTLAEIEQRLAQLEPEEETG